MRCRKIMNFKYAGLLSAKWLFYFSLFLILYFNFSAMLNSGVLSSGGGEFNADVKYTLIINNFNMIGTMYALLLAIFLGAGMIGPDLTTGNIYVILSAYPSRKKYYAFTCLAGWTYFLGTYLLLCGNLLLLLWIFDIEILWLEVGQIMVSILLNATVIFVITSMGSVYMKGYKGVVVGLFAYAFYYIYTFNTIPFVNGALTYNVTQYRDILFYFVPMTYSVPASVADPALVDRYHISSFFNMPMLYQCIYGMALLWFGSMSFQRKDL